MYVPSSSALTRLIQRLWSLRISYLLHSPPPGWVGHSYRPLLAPPGQTTGSGYIKDLGRDRYWYPWTHEWRWVLLRAGATGCGEQSSLCQVRDAPLPSFLGVGMFLSWLGVLIGSRRGLLTCLWAVPHPPCASLVEVGDLPAPHMGNPQGHQPRPPDSLVYAGMRDALWRGSEWIVRGSAHLLTPQATRNPKLRVPTQDHKFGCSTLPFSCHIGGHTHVHPCIALERE